MRQNSHRAACPLAGFPEHKARRVDLEPGVGPRQAHGHRALHPVQQGSPNAAALVPDQQVGREQAERKVQPRQLRAAGCAQVRAGARTAPGLELRSCSAEPGPL